MSSLSGIKLQSSFALGQEAQKFSDDKNANESDINNFESTEIKGIAINFERSVASKNEGTEIELGGNLLEKDEAVEDANDSLSLSNSSQSGIPPLDYKYNNLSSWKPTSLDPKIQLLKFKLTQEITYREHLLDQLSRMVTSLDTRYWKYCVLRIRTAEENKSLHSEQLVSQRNRIVVMQNELGALIAHVRSLSLDVVDSIQKLRYAFRKEYETNEGLSLYFAHQNYLVKIKDDLKRIFYCDMQLIQYWLGFEPNTFMIPPQRHVGDKDMAFNLLGHALLNPFEEWHERIFEGVFMQWFRAHSEKMARELKHRKSNHLRKKLKSATNRLHIEHHDSPTSHQTLHNQPDSPSAELDASHKIFHIDLATESRDTVLTGASVDTLVKGDENNENSNVQHFSTDDLDTADKEVILNTPSDIEVRSANNDTLSDKSVAAPSVVSEETNVPAADAGIPVEEIVLPTNETELPIALSPTNKTIEENKIIQQDDERIEEHDLANNNDMDSHEFPSDAIESMADAAVIVLESLATGKPLEEFAIPTTATAPATAILRETEQDLEEWRQLRKYAGKSWGVDENTGQRGQGRTYAREFWTNYDQNPFVVEAIIGFQEVFPRFAIVPTVPLELQTKCAKAESVVLSEVRDVERYIESFFFKTKIVNCFFS